MRKILKNINIRSYYITREGLLVEIWCIDPQSRRPFPVKGHIHTPEGVTYNGTWTRKGRWPQDQQNPCNHPKDLIEVSKEEWTSLFKPKP